MKALIRIVQLGIVIHLVWAAATGIVVTFSLGHIVHTPFAFMGLSYPENVVGIPGETHFSWPFYIAIFINRLIYLYAFYRLWQMFGAFFNLQYFTKKTIGHLYAFTGLFTFFTLSRIAISWLFIKASANSLPDGMSLNESYQEIMNLGYPVLFFVIAHILKEARKNEEILDTYF